MASRIEIQKELSLLLRSRHSLIWMITKEERRAVSVAREAAVPAGYPLLRWDSYTGLRDPSLYDPTRSDADLVSRIADPMDIIAWIKQDDQRRCYLLCDFDEFLTDPFSRRALRSLALELESAPRSRARAVVVVTPQSQIPPQLEGHAEVFDMPLPDRDEVADQLAAAIKGLKPEYQEKAIASDEKRDAAIDAALGLGAQAIRNAYSLSLVTPSEVLDPEGKPIPQIEPEIITAEKRRVISKTKGASWVTPDPRGLAAVGGLEVLKDWVMKRRKLLTQEARQFGLPAPKGILVVGIQGCGKSLLAKTLAATWGVPLVKADLGGTRERWVGASEENIRELIKMLEALGPAICWIDEIEKALGGATQGAADGGVSSDMLGELLTWLQERQGQTFVVATSNDISKLPPELLRKGRFDEVWFVDLPNTAERRAILDVSLRKAGRDPAELGDTTELVRSMEGFVGSEIDSVVVSGLTTAFHENMRELTLADLTEAAEELVPLSRTMKEQIDRLRRWASEGRARFASAPDATPTQSSNGRSTELDV